MYYILFGLFSLYYSTIIGLNIVWPHPFLYVIILSLISKNDNGQLNFWYEMSS